MKYKYITKIEDINNFIVELANSDNNWKNLIHKNTTVEITDFSEIGEGFYADVSMFNDKTKEYDEYIFSIDDFSVTARNKKDHKIPYCPLDFTTQWAEYMLKAHKTEYASALNNDCKDSMIAVVSNYKKEKAKIVEQLINLKQKANKKLIAYKKLKDMANEVLKEKTKDSDHTL